jgi:hypothetical protein
LKAQAHLSIDMADEIIEEIKGKIFASNRGITMGSDTGVGKYSWRVTRARRYYAPQCPNGSRGCNISYHWAGNEQEILYRCFHKDCAKDLLAFLPPWNTFLQRDQLFRCLPEAPWPGDCMAHVFEDGGMATATIAGCCDVCRRKHDTERDRFVSCALILRCGGVLPEISLLIIGLMERI